MREWQLGPGRLIQGDCRELEWDAETLIFDPGYDSELTGWRPGASHDALVFSPPYQLQNALSGWDLPYRTTTVWDTAATWHGSHRPLERCRMAIWFGRTKYRTCASHLSPECEEGRHLAHVFRWPKQRRETDHPHEKPLDWIRCLIGNCTSGLVVDPFAGSGTTGVACLQLGREFLLIEREEKWCDVIRRRLGPFVL